MRLLSTAKSRWFARALTDMPSVTTAGSQADAPEIDGKIFFLSEDKVRVGEYVKVKIDDTMDYDLIGSKM